MKGAPLFIFAMAVLSAGLRFAMFPPFSIAEAAYFFLIPLLWVDWTGARMRSVFGWGCLAGFLFWIASIFWLRHVTWGGTLGLSLILSAFTGLWLLLFVKVIRRGDQSSPPGLSQWAVPLAGAAAWVILEWIRSWLFWGFPWNPVSVSQWNRPAALAIVPVTGGWGLTFFLIWINIALAQWLRHSSTEWRRRGFLPMGWRVPLPLIVPVGVLLAGACWFFWKAPQVQPSEPVRVGFVQPYATMKWDREAVSQNLRNLWQETQALAPGNPQIILWPESATPVPVIGDVSIRDEVEALSRDRGAPILMGNMAVYRREGIYDNAVFLVEPEGGLVADYYIKRELVPFGEFIPFREQLPFLEKVVPIGLDCRRGEEVVLFPFPSAEQTSGPDRIAPLICYEDVFPRLARANVRAGADWLFVATNNVWYGEEAGAYQHAAHSVLRAVETRRPVLRSGNGGWSGWIDEWGNIRKVVTNEEGTIYFKGGETVPVFRDQRFDGVVTPYVANGDWFVAFCGVVLGWAWIRRIWRPAAGRSGQETSSGKGRFS